MTFSACGLCPAEAKAIERKTGADVHTLIIQKQFGFWRTAHGQFVKRLVNTNFNAIVFDYDGTLCDEAHRFNGPNGELMSRIARLLKAGIVVGIATGRGKSARVALRQSIPKQSWPRVCVGYYNGADIGSLDDDSRPQAEAPCGAFGSLAKVLESDPRLIALSECTSRRTQVSLSARPLSSIQMIWEVTRQIVSQSELPDVSVVRSGHSVDILAPGVSKLAVVRRVREMISPNGDTQSAAVLCIGDQGRYPGNDAELLTEPHSLSVHEVSPDPQTCWHLAPPGYRGTQAAIHYLDRLEVVSSTTFRFLKVPKR